MIAANYSSRPFLEFLARSVLFSDNFELCVGSLEILRRF